METRTSAVDRLLGGESPRADARRNVEKLVAAAREAIAEVGVEAATSHEIAGRAGVGVGTFYRRIPSRELLLEAVLTELLAEIADLADTAAQDRDPWAGFCLFAAGYVRLRAESCGIGEALGGACAELVERPLAELRERIRLLVERAQQAGAIRPDVAWQDVPYLLAGVATGPRTIGLTADAGQWGRNLRIVLDGLATARPGALPGTPPVAG